MAMLTQEQRDFLEDPANQPIAPFSYTIEGPDGQVFFQSSGGKLLSTLPASSQSHVYKEAIQKFREKAENVRGEYGDAEEPGGGQAEGNSDQGVY